MHSRVGFAAAALLAVAIALPSPWAAWGAVTVFGNANAQACAQAAVRAEKGRPMDQQAFALCNEAIASEDLQARDRAGTFINRGILYLFRGEYGAAKDDFDSAAQNMPTLGEAYTNRGAALLALRRYSDAIADLNRGLELNSSEPEKAYFNRALAEEALDRIKDAYVDYTRAAELKPDWVLPRNELARFTVSAPPS